VDGHTKICRHHGTDFIGCRRDKGGASIGTGAVRDRCYVTKLKELYRHPGATATVCWQKYSPKKLCDGALRVILKADCKTARPHRLQDRTVCGRRPWCVYDRTVHHDRKNQTQLTTVHMTKRFSHITARPWVKCGRADLQIFLDLKMTKPNYKPNTGPNANPNTKQILILI